MRVVWEEVLKTKSDVKRCEVTTFARGRHCVRHILGSFKFFDLLVMVLSSFRRWCHLYVHSSGGITCYFAPLLCRFVVLVTVVDPSVTTFGCFSVFLRQKQMFGGLRRLY